MIIERASPADAHRIAEIHCDARLNAMPWLPLLHSPDKVRWYFETIVLPVEKVLIAREGVQAVGFISVAEGWLNHLYIDPERWGSGIGRRLLDEIRSEASYLQLRVFQQNLTARRFYFDRGFRECELTNGQHNEEKMPDARMEWVRAD